MSGAAPVLIPSSTSIEVRDSQVGAPEDSAEERDEVAPRGSTMLSHFDSAEEKSSAVKWDSKADLVFEDELPESSDEDIGDAYDDDSTYFPPGHEVNIRTSIRTSRATGLAFTSSRSSDAHRQFATTSIFQQLRAGAASQRSQRRLFMNNSKHREREDSDDSLDEGIFDELRDIGDDERSRGKSQDKKKSRHSSVKAATYHPRSSQTLSSSAKKRGKRTSGVDHAKKHAAHSKGSDMDSETHSEDGDTTTELKDDSHRTAGHYHKDTVDLILEDLDVDDLLQFDGEVAGPDHYKSKTSAAAAAHHAAVRSGKLSGLEELRLTEHYYSQARRRGSDDSDGSVEDVRRTYQINRLRKGVAPRYTLERRVSSAEMIEQKYLKMKKERARANGIDNSAATRMTRSKKSSRLSKSSKRPRRKSDPGVSDFTMRRLATLPASSMPRTTNLFLLPAMSGGAAGPAALAAAVASSAASPHTRKKQWIESRFNEMRNRHEFEKRMFRDLFDDSDLSDEDFLFDDLTLANDEDVMDVRTTNVDEKMKRLVSVDSEHRTTTIEALKGGSTHAALRRGTAMPGSSKSPTGASSSAESKPERVEFAGAHTYASEHDIAQEFGEGMETKQSFSVKKRDKWSLDRARILVLDLSMQVLRVKDKSGKTHKEHLVDSILSVDDFVSPKHPEIPQLKIKFKDSHRDYHLTFESSADMKRFKDLLLRLQQFKEKIESVKKKLSFKSDRSVGSSGLPRMTSFGSVTGAGSPPETPLSGDEDDTMDIGIELSPDASIAADGDVYTGAATKHVSFLIQYTNRWGAIRSRTLVVHVSERVIRLFDEKRKCKNEFLVEDIDTIEVYDKNTMEAVFSKQSSRSMRPFRAEFKSNADLSFFIEQCKVLKPSIILSRGETGARGTVAVGLGYDVVTLEDESVNASSEASSDPSLLLTHKDGASMLSLDEGSSMGSSAAQRFLSVSTFGRFGRSVGSSKDGGGAGSVISGVDSLLDSFGSGDFENEFLLRFLVLRLIRSRAGQSVTWKQHRRVVFLDLLGKIIKMKTVGMHIKDYPFSDVVSMEKSYGNCKQLHITVLESGGGKGYHDYWYEFMTAPARDEFVGRVLFGMQQDSSFGVGAVGGKRSTAAAALSDPTEELMTRDDATVDDTNPDLDTPRPRASGLGLALAASQADGGASSSPKSDSSAFSPRLGSPRVMKKSGDASSPTGSAKKMGSKKEGSPASPKPSVSTFDTGKDTLAGVAAEVDELTAVADAFLEAEDTKEERCDEEEKSGEDGSKEEVKMMEDEDYDEFDEDGFHIARVVTGGIIDDDMIFPSTYTGRTTALAPSFSTSSLVSTSHPPTTVSYSEEMYGDNLKIMIASWNVGEAEPENVGLKKWFPPPSKDAYDLYVIGLQECDTSLRKNWVRAVLAHVNEGKSSGEDREYVVFHRSFLLQIGCFLIVRKRLVHRISHVENQEVACGKGNMIGNKGAACISFQIDCTQLCFICCHLAARAERVEKRAKDSYRIFKQLQLGRPGLDVLHQFDHVFFFGDLNYRIQQDFHIVCDMINEKKYTEIWQYDQLMEEMRRGNVFPRFSEGMISFPPTYRWKRDVNEVSNKREQSPSYCDRILYYSLPETEGLLRLLAYRGSAYAFGSDHRPIYGAFAIKTRRHYFTANRDFVLHGSAVLSKPMPVIDNAFIDLVAMRATFVGLPGLIEHDEIEMFIHCQHFDATYKISEGHYDPVWHMFSWPMLDEADLNARLKPVIKDPECLSESHIHLVFSNSSKSNAVVGYSSFSLRNAFTKHVITALEKSVLVSKLRSNPGMMRSSEELKKAIEDAENAIRMGKERMSPKKFSEPIILHGRQIGTLDGFAQCQLTFTDALFAGS